MILRELKQQATSLIGELDIADQLTNTVQPQHIRDARAMMRDWCTAITKTTNDPCRRAHYLEDYDQQ